MSTRERFQIDLLRQIIRYHDGHLLESGEILEVLEDFVAKAEGAKDSKTENLVDWFDEWMERQGA